MQKFQTLIVLCRKQKCSISFDAGVDQVDLSDNITYRGRYQEASRASVCKPEFGDLLLQAGGANAEN